MLPHTSRFNKFDIFYGYFTYEVIEMHSGKDADCGPGVRKCGRWY